MMWPSPATTSRRASPPSRSSSATVSREPASQPASSPPTKTTHRRAHEPLEAGRVRGRAGVARERDEHAEPLGREAGDAERAQPAVRDADQHEAAARRAEALVEARHEIRQELLGALEEERARGRGRGDDPAAAKRLGRVGAGRDAARRVDVLAARRQREHDLVRLCRVERRRHEEDDVEGPPRAEVDPLDRAVARCDGRGRRLRRRGGRRGRRVAAPRRHRARGRRGRGA